MTPRAKSIALQPYTANRFCNSASRCYDNVKSILLGISVRFYDTVLKLRPGSSKHLVHGSKTIRTLQTEFTFFVFTLLTEMRMTSERRERGEVGVMEIANREQESSEVNATDNRHIDH